MQKFPVLKLELLIVIFDFEGVELDLLQHVDLYLTVPYLLLQGGYLMQLGLNMLVRQVLLSLVCFFDRVEEDVRDGDLD